MAGPSSAVRGGRAPAHDAVARPVPVPMDVVDVPRQQRVAAHAGARAGDVNPYAPSFFPPVINAAANSMAGSVAGCPRVFLINA